MTKIEQKYYVAEILEGIFPQNNQKLEDYIYRVEEVPNYKITMLLLNGDFLKQKLNKISKTKSASSVSSRGIVQYRIYVKAKNIFQAFSKIKKIIKLSIFI